MTIQTCKDCIKHKRCTNENKEYVITEDGDSWAFYCDDFQVRRRMLTVRKGKYEASQGRYGGVTVIDKEAGRWIFHCRNGKKLTRKELREDIQFAVEELPKLTSRIVDSEVKENDNGQEERFQT